VIRIDQYLEVGLRDFSADTIIEQQWGGIGDGGGGC